MASPFESYPQEIERLMAELEEEKAILEKALRSPIIQKAAEFKEAVIKQAQFTEHINREREKKLEKERKNLIDQKQQLRQAIEQRVTELVSVQTVEMINLKVGEKVFATTPTTISSIPGSVLDITLKEMWKHHPEKTQIIIDRDPTHFDKILNYLRDGKKSLLWLKDERLSSIDLLYVKQEAEFYILKSLAQLITCEIVRRKPVVQDLPITCSLNIIKNPGAERGRDVVAGYRTTKEMTICEENFGGCKISHVQFSHSLVFKSCNFSGAVFQKCFFQVVIDFDESNMEGVKFKNCGGVMSPKEMLHINVDEDCESRFMWIPHTW